VLNTGKTISDTGHSGGMHLFRYASPQTFFPVAGKLIPMFAVVALLLCSIGFYIGFFLAPTDVQQHDSYRIIYLHVASAWMAMIIYMAMAFWAGVGLIMNTRLSSMMASALAPTGAMFCFLSLWTGSLWGKPAWGTWWVWDARLTSVLILLFLYIGFMALQAAIDEPRRADKASAVLALVGVINVPIIYFSVQWWNTLHQGSSLNMSGGAPKMAPIMLWGMLIMALGFWAYSFMVALLRLRCIVLERERHTDWVKEYMEKTA